MKVKPFIFLTLAGVINAIGVTVFLAPVDLYDSGISGTSILLSQVTPAWMSLSFFLLLLNVPLFLYGYRKQGLSFTACSLYAIGIYSLAAFLITDVLPVDVSIASPLAGRDLLLCSIFGGLLSGVGSGLTIRSGGAIDGIDVLAIIFAKRIGISVGTFVMGYNLLIYTLSGILLRSWILPLYSIVAYVAALKTVDFLVEGLDRSKAAMIVTAKAGLICAALSDEFQCGITILEGKGYYSGSRKEIIYIVLNRFQIPRLKALVHELDPLAYITITEIADVFLKQQEGGD